MEDPTSAIEQLLTIGPECTQVFFKLVSSLNLDNWGGMKAPTECFEERIIGEKGVLGHHSHVPESIIGP